MHEETQWKLKLKWHSTFWVNRSLAKRKIVIWFKFNLKNILLALLVNSLSTHKFDSTSNWLTMLCLFKIDLVTQQKENLAFEFRKLVSQLFWHFIQFGSNSYERSAKQEENLQSNII
jgi:hypothetical protein